MPTTNKTDRTALLFSQICISTFKELVPQIETKCARMVATPPKQLQQASGLIYLNARVCASIHVIHSAAHQA